MTNRIALALGLLVVFLVVLDAVVYGSEHLIYMGRKFADLIEWMAFWR